MGDQVQYGYFGHIAKYEKTEDGTLMVYGKAAGPDIDLDEQICDPTWLKTAMPNWSKWGNVREQHANIAAGVGVELTQDGDDWYLKAEIVDPATIRKVEKRVLKGFSVGIVNGMVRRDAKARGGRITDGTIAEISLVDRPANPTATLSIAKSAGGAALEPVEADEVSDMPEQIEQPGDDEAPSLFDGLDFPELGGAGSSGAPLIDLDAPEDDEPGLFELPAEPLEKSAGWYRDSLRLVEDALAGQWSHTVSFISKAAKPADDGEHADVAGAQAAIDQIADLIVSEAQSLKGGRLAELRDIEVLLQAARALCCFIEGEQGEDGAELDDDDVTGDDKAYMAKAFGSAWTIDDEIGESAASSKAAGGDTLGTDTTEITKAIATATAEMQRAHEADMASLRAQLDKALKAPAAGGPVTFKRVNATSTAPSQASSEAAQWRAKADAPGLDAGVRRAYIAKAASLEGAST